MSAPLPPSRARASAVPMVEPEGRGAKARRLAPVTTAGLSVWDQLKEAAVPVVMYHVVLLFSLFAFSAVVLVTEGFDLGGIFVLVFLAGTTLIGTVLGQFMAFLRIRTWVAMTLGAVCWGLAFGLGLATSAVLGEAGIFVFLFLFMLPIAMTGGIWSLETHRATWSIWLPMVYTSATAIIWAEKTGLDDNWFAGDKWAVWDLVSLGVFGTTVILTLIYLVTRETHRLALWRRGPTAPMQPSLKELGASRPRITPLGFATIAILTVVVTIATAVISPYLWRTGPSDGDGDGGGEPKEQGQEREPDYGEGEPAEPSEDGPFMKAAKELAEKGVEAAKQAGGSICSLLVLAILAVIGLLIAGPPLRRLFVVRHLQDPLWHVANTTRIEMGWQLVEIALGDAGVQVRTGEDAAGLARRAAPMLNELSMVQVHGLEDAAEVIDRVRFGLGVGPKDVATMERFARWTYDTVWERLSDWQQVKCMYRTI